MHRLNKKDFIGTDFFAKPAAVGGIRVEHIFNKIYGKIPFKLSFSEKFEMTCMEAISENFDSFCSEITQFENKVIDEGFWIGKCNTEYDGIVISVAFQADSSDDLPYSVQALVNSYRESPDFQKELLGKLHVHVSAACFSREEAHNLATLLSPHRMVSTTKMYILASNYGDLAFTPMPIPDMSVDLALNYGDSFIEFNDKFIETINTENSGLYLFYGSPGTGKSSYIKYLLSGKMSRKAAYIPVSLIDKLTHPDMVPLLMSNKGIVLVLEDAEKALLSREISENSSIVSTILNLTDGFIGQALNISIIATFNTEKEKIDEALLRKGRLKLSYEFKKLEKENCQKIIDKLGIDADIQESMSLAEVYNYTKPEAYKKEEKRRVGFN